MSDTFTLNFKPNAMQRGFIESRAIADLFSSRRGEGKSTGLAWSIFYHTRNNPGAAWAVVRDTGVNLRTTTMKTFFEWFPPGICGSYNITNKEFTWAEGLAKGTVTFVGMDDPQDATKFLSWELGGIAMDEPAPASGSAGIDEMIFDLGMTCFRQPGMKWYSMKLAENNPDESHWTYKKFVAPGMDGYVLWQPPNPENERNLPPDYYEKMRASLAHRPDLQRRFVDGEFGYQVEGKQVTPQWNDKLHLVTGMNPLPRYETVLCWDFGLNPTCLVTQRTPLGHWNVLDSMVGEGIGTEELIVDWVKPLITDRYQKCPLRHIGDPAGANREQSSSARSAVRVIKQTLGGNFKKGPVFWQERLAPTQAVLTRTIGGHGLVQVDRNRAQQVWFALRGGWHYNVARTGVVSGLPKKNIHSHPGDAFSYAAAVLFPLGRAMPKGDHEILPENPATASYFDSGKWDLPSEMPQHGDKLPDPEDVIAQPDSYFTPYG